MSPYPPIADYGLLSDGHSAALVSKDGSVDWCCFHRFDARPVFSRLLDWERGGWFRIAPEAPYRVARRYLPDTNVLETTFTTRSGALEVVDCLPVRRRGAHPYHQLVRLVRCRRGDVRVSVEFCPRFDYGLTTPRTKLRGRNMAVAYGGADAVVLQSTLKLSQTEPSSCGAHEQLGQGDEHFVVATYMEPHELRPARLGADVLRKRVDETVAYWRDWAERCTYEGPYRNDVVRSALVLKALTHELTGAIVAAPTTSLPEHIGGTRNWDYRYAWLRDAAMTLRSLFALGHRDEAHAFMEWLMRTTAGRAEDIRILYGVGGERLVPELELAELEGYRGSAPVRIGNAAADQFQLDAYGYMLDTAWQYVRNTGRMNDEWWELLRGCADQAAKRWSEADDGIWEVRGGRRHFVTSKVLAAVALDRAVRIAGACGFDGDTGLWRRTEAAIRAAIDRRGVDRTGAFVQRFGSGDVDASALLFPLVRFVRPDDPRARRTVARIESELTQNGFVRRYRTPDGVPGDEGAFVICSFWLVDNLALMGEVDRACELFERLCGSANDLGLLAEQIDPSTGDHLGNFPQAFSHIGLIGAALNLAKAQR